MPFKVRVSKFRHVFGTPYREQDCYKNIAITRNAHDGSFCAVNSKFLAIVTETSGGGSFLVILLSEVCQFLFFISFSSKSIFDIGRSCRCRSSTYNWSSWSSR
jgi:hypothetical protein